jgi:Fur family peroxide stress response transcriptional regulator
MVRTAPENDFQASLKEKGYKLTLQRMAIYEALQDGPRHPTAEEVHAHVSHKYPMIGLSTVYNTLETLNELGLVNKIAIQGAVARYDIEITPHAHLMCLKCGRIVEFEANSFEHCKTEIRQKHHFEVLRQEATFFGYCQDCLESQAKD